MIRILNVIEDTTVDGVGLRTAVYAAGCYHACPGCHNPESWNMDNGTPTSIEEVLKRVLDDPFADVTFTGGDPMFQAKEFSELARAIKEHSSKNIWCYTGYVFEQLLSMPDCRSLLEYVDVLVDGKFIHELRDESLRFRGSSNQRIIDVQASLHSEKTIIYDLNSIK